MLQLTNGNLVSSTSESIIKLWDVQTNECIQTLTHKNDSYYKGITHILELTNGRLVSANTSIKIWCLDRGECLTTIQYTSYNINTLLQLNNNRLLTMDNEAFINVWG